MENLESIRGKIAAVLKEKGWSLRFTWDDNRWAKGKAHAWIVGSAVPLAVYVGIWAIA